MNIVLQTQFGLVGIQPDAFAWGARRKAFDALSRKLGKISAQKLRADNFGQIVRAR